MATIKCKMCGGDLTVTPDSSVAECEYCGSLQTIPNQDNEKKLTLFARANRLRFACEFDKAAGIYETIVSDFPEEAEAYWGLVLCKYGIEYVDDPATGKKIPTCHRSSFDSVLDDEDYEQSLENADAVARRLYRDEARRIEEIRKGIIEVSGREEPYDVFICYKETAPDGQRTLDSVLAQDIYDALTDKGYRTFFARITLEDKLGQEYEPFIFAALNSAKVMLAVGTDYEYYNAVWVKNEWGRFLKLMEKDKSKHLIPCYKGIDAYDMPKEFNRLQAQDLGKIGAIQDLLRGIGKLLPKQEKTVVVQQAAVNTSAMVMRGRFSLEDGDFAKAAEYFERALDQDPQDADAYVGKTLVRLRLSSEQMIAERFVVLEGDKDFERALRFAQGARKAQLEQLYGLCQKKYLVKRLSNGLRAVSRQKQRAEVEERTRAVVGQIEEYIREGTVESYQQAIDLFVKAQTDRINSRMFTDIKLAGYCRQQKILQLLQQQNTLMTVDEITKAFSSENIARVTVLQHVAFMQEHDVIQKTRLYNQDVYGTRASVEALLHKQAERNKLNEWKAQYLEPYRRRIEPVQNRFLASGYLHTPCLVVNGTVTVAGNPGMEQCQTSQWRDIVAVAAGDYHTVGLRTDGTVVATTAPPNNSKYTVFDAGQCKVSGWKNIVQICAAGTHTVGLRASGTVIAVGDNEHYQCDVADWRNIQAIRTGRFKTVGLKDDGTVVVSNGIELDWRNIADVAVGDLHTVGLKLDGTVLGEGKNDVHQLDVDAWEDIIAVAAGNQHTVGLCADGTVVAVGDNTFGQCNVEAWRNIVAIAASEYHTVALRADGTVVSTKGDYAVFNRERLLRKCDTASIRLFGNIDSLEQERRQWQQEAERQRQELERKMQEYERQRVLAWQRQQAMMWRNAGRCQHCGGEMKGLFSKKCTACGKPKDY